jgi:hypothetical protein
MCESNKIVQFDAMTVLTSFDSSLTRQKHYNDMTNVRDLNSIF